MRDKKVAVFLVLCNLIFAAYLYHVQFFKNLVYDQNQMDSVRTRVVDTSTNKYQYQFYDDLVKPAAEFNTSDFFLYSASARYTTEMSYVVHTSTNKYKNQFHDDLVKPAAEFNTSDFFFLYSTVARNTTEMSYWDTVSVIGWESENLSEQVYTCCLLYPSGRIALSLAERIVLKKPLPSPMRASQFVCKMQTDIGNEKATAAKLTSGKNPSDCKKAPTSYIGIGYPYKHPKEIAIFAKLIYGSVYARDLITWFEVHKLLGFSKVLIYPYLLNPNASRVLKYYERLGLLEIFPIPEPGPAPGSQANHRHVALMDGHIRLRGYKYIVSFDVDEYIIPKRNESWMDLFDSLFREKEDAAAFFFRTYYYIKNWEAVNKTSTFTIGRYLNRTRITTDRTKHVSMPNRLLNGGFTTHKVFPFPEYKSYQVSETYAAIHHFRHCRTPWRHENADFPCYDQPQFYDDSVNSLFKVVEKDVLHVVSELKV